MGDISPTANLLVAGREDRGKHSLKKHQLPKMKIYNVGGTLSVLTSTVCVFSSFFSVEIQYINAKHINCSIKYIANKYGGMKLSGLPHR